MQARVVDLAARRTKARKRAPGATDATVVLSAHPGTVVLTVGEASIGFEPERAKDLGRDLVRLAKVASKAAPKRAP